MGSRHRTLCCSALVLAALCSPTHAWAEPWTTPTGVTGAGLGLGEEPPVRLWGDVGFYTNHGNWTTAHVFGAGIGLGKSLELEAVLPTAAVFGDVDSRFALGNVFIGAAYINRGPTWRVKFGGGVGLPLARADDLSETFLYVSAAAMRALQDPWLWAVDTVPIVAPLHVEVPAGSPIVLTIDASATVLAPVRDRNGTDLYLAGAPGAGFHLGDVATLGMRLPMAASPTTNASDKGNIYVEPFVRVSSSAAFLSMRMDLKLDDAGRFTDDRGIWGFHIGFGVSL